MTKKTLRAASLPPAGDRSAVPGRQKNNSSLPVQEDICPIPCGRRRFVSFVKDRCGRLAGETRGRTRQMAVLTTGRLPVRLTPLVGRDGELVRAGLRHHRREQGSGRGRCATRLDGLPLAIELAAARMRVLSVGQLARRLDDVFGVLTGGARSAPARHQALRATLDWSCQLLNGPERTVFRRLAVFVGGSTLPAAEQVTALRGRLLLHAEQRGTPTTTSASGARTGSTTRSTSRSSTPPRRRSTSSSASTTPGPRSVSSTTARATPTATPTTSARRSSS